MHLLPTQQSISISLQCSMRATTDVSSVSPGWNALSSSRLYFEQIDQHRV